MKGDGVGDGGRDGGVQALGKFAEMPQGTPCAAGSHAQYFLSA